MTNIEKLRKHNQGANFTATAANKINKGNMTPSFPENPKIPFFVLRGLCHSGLKRC